MQLSKGHLRQEKYGTQVTCVFLNQTFTRGCLFAINQRSIRECESANIKQKANVYHCVLLAYDQHSWLAGATLYAKRNCLSNMLAFIRQTLIANVWLEDIPNT